MVRPPEGATVSHSPCVRLKMISNCSPNNQRNPVGGQSQRAAVAAVCGCTGSLSSLTKCLLVITGVTGFFFKSQAQYGSFRFFVRKEALQAGLLALEPPARSPASQPSPWAAGSQLVPRVSAEQSPPLEAALTAFLALGSFPPCALHGACQTSSPTLSPTPAVWLDLHQTCGPCVLLPQPPGLPGTQTPSAGVH